MAGQSVMRIRTGRISYANLFPIFYMLQREEGDRYEFIEGVPSELNRLIRTGSIDISPSSSVEYLRHKDLYNLIDGHSISSFGPVGSILLFSRKPIETLDGADILTSSHSETSVVLLKIILRKFYGLDINTTPSSDSLSRALKSHDAYLLIGDMALKEAPRQPDAFIYDLGDIWYKHTGLPSVFALWIAHRAFSEKNPGVLDMVRADLDRSRASALGCLGEIAQASGLRHELSEEALVSYWKSISFDLDDRHKKGLGLFEIYAGELDLL